MKVAIVGGTGAFGQALAKRLVEIGQDDVDLVVLAVKSNATLETAAELADAIGTTPVLCVASDLRFTDDGVLPGRHQGSLAEEVARLMRGPVASGFQSFAAANVVEGDPGDALICGGQDRAKELAL